MDGSATSVAASETHRTSQKLLEDFQQAIWAKDVRDRSTLHLVRSAVTSAEIEARRPLNDEEALEVIAKQAKRRLDAIEEFSRACRQDPMEQEQVELAIIEEYLPRQPERQEIEALAREAIAEVRPHGLSQIGDVMRHLIPRRKGRADGHLVNQLVREMLSKGP